MDQVLEVLKGLCLLVVALIGLGIGTSGGTQLVKVFLRELSAKLPWLDLSGSRAFILAAAMAFFVTYYFHVDLSQYLQLLDGFDADLVQLLTAILTMIVSNKFHDNYLTAG